MWAAHWDDRDIVAALLAAGARVNAADDHGVTPLARACENASLAVVETLLQAGADPNAAQTSGLTPLMIAAETGNVGVVADAAGARRGRERRHRRTGATALMWAVAAPHHDIARVLIEAGADVRVSSSKGFTPLLFAARNGDIEMAKILLAAGAQRERRGVGRHAGVAAGDRQPARQVRAVPARAGRRSERLDGGHPGPARRGRQRQHVAG